MYHTQKNEDSNQATCFFYRKGRGSYFGSGIKKTPSDYRKRFAVIWFRKHQFGFTAGIPAPP